MCGESHKHGFEGEVEVARLLSTLTVTNQAEHIQLAREAQNAIAQLSTDGQVLEHVREIIRFFKEA